MIPGYRGRAWMLAVIAAVPCALWGQGPAPDLSLDSLLSTRISAASKYEQTTSEAPASVTILTSEHLERLGYSRLGEVLEGVRGFYMTATMPTSARAASAGPRTTTTGSCC